MIVLKRALMACAVAAVLTGEAYAAEVMLKIACVEASVLNSLKTSAAGDAPAIDYSALIPVLNDSVAGAGHGPAVNSSLVQPVVRDIAPALQALYPEQGRVIGRQMPRGSSCWHRFIISCSTTAQNAFIELGVDHGVLASLAAGVGGAALRNSPIQQYTHGSSPEGDAVFTTGYSVFLQQISRSDGRAWLEQVMPMKDGLGVLALRRSATETRTDTLIIRIDPALVPHSAAGIPEVLIVAGWER